MPVLGTAARAALTVLAMASMAACASRPKPMGPVATNAPIGVPAPSEGAAGPGGGEDQNRAGAPTPGSRRDFVINAGDLVYFDFDRFEVRAQARPTLDAQAAWLARYPAVRVRIEGNCDEQGTREYNFALGARRANAVRDYLVERGLAPGRFDTVSYGKEHPIDTGSGDEADQHNRNARTVITEGDRP